MSADHKPPALPSHDAHCLNCGALLVGEYCARCGQHVKHHVHSTWETVKEFFEDLFHADQRLWRTLVPLVFKPGFLTVEYLGGRRVSYTPPFRLYIVLSLIFFLFASIDNPYDEKNVVAPVATGDKADERVPDPAMCTPATLDGLPGDLGADERLQEACRKITAANSGFNEALAHNIPKMMFAFLPLIALAGKLLYIRPRHYYAEHLLFFVHYHSFFFFTTTIAMVVAFLFGWLQALGAGPWMTASYLLTTAVTFYVPAYLFLAMRRVYGQRRLLTLAKFVLLTIAYLFCLLLTLVGLVAFTALTL